MWLSVVHTYSAWQGLKLKIFQSVSRKLITIGYIRSYILIYLQLTKDMDVNIIWLHDLSIIATNLILNNKFSTKKCRRRGFAFFFLFFRRSRGDDQGKE